MIANKSIKMIYYEIVKVTIDVSGLTEIMMDVIIKYYGLGNLIISNYDLIFISEFWFSLYYFLGIK